MASKPPVLNPDLNLKLTIIAVILIASTSVPFVDSRPSTTNNSQHTVLHENTDVAPQEAEPLNRDNDHRPTEISEEQDFEDGFNNEEVFPQRDAPVNVNADSNIPRKADNRHAKTNHVKNGRRVISEQPPAEVIKVASEANYSLSGVLEDNLDEFNDTTNGDHGDNTSMTDENFIRLSKNNRESQEFDHADRNRELRLNAIKEIIQSYRSGIPGETKPTKVSSAMIGNFMDHLNVSQTPLLDAYPMKRRSFHPLCSLPNNTDNEMWVDSSSMNLLFNLTYPDHQNTTVTIIAATLRLYKFAQGNRTSVESSCTPNIVSTPVDDGDIDNVPEIQRDSTLIPESISLLPQTPGTIALQDDDKQIRVSVYWYTRSLKKKNKVKRKLLDSRMLPVYGKNEWVEFNVRHAARQWRQLKKNYGIVVEVENEDGELLKASEYFKTMNCSNEASAAKPLPGVFMQAYHSYIKSNNSSGGAGFDIAAYLRGSTGFTYSTSNGNGEGKKRDLGDEIPAGKFSNSPYVYSLLFPMIDMCTVEIPAQEAHNAAFLQHTQYLLTQHLAACKNSNKQNQTDILLIQGASSHIIPTEPLAVDLIKNETVVETLENLDQNNLSHIHREGHKKEYRPNNHDSVHLSPQEEVSIQDPAHGYKLRHSRHKHRQHNNNHFDGDLSNRHNNSGEENENEREKIKEEITLTDEFGHELKKKNIVKDVIRSSTHRTVSISQHDSGR